jgi:hypothetical protein
MMLSMIPFLAAGGYKGVTGWFEEREGPEHIMVEDSCVVDSIENSNCESARRLLLSSLGYTFSREEHVPAVYDIKGALLDGLAPLRINVTRTSSIYRQIKNQRHSTSTKSRHSSDI